MRKKKKPVKSAKPTINQLITKKYNELLNDVATNDFYKKDLTNSVNVYTCPDGHITKTVDVDAGVTPFMHKCSKCNKWATSSFYKGIAPNEEPVEEWYRPTLEETLKLANNTALLDHVLKGGLLCRKIVKTEKPVQP